ncbi:UDP-3-O-(3-hydroxymyristoyl)glucosamine N-acyltransferase [Corticibacter populi]|uniref:UDP-3-O-acylglucosamine N-acyltransferase n=1 Tax=Corticibacter populi TaxID=1550736 RepID=A0A3M6QSJ6_9BURK|nr:UDP-3-O-(3-hydroxymyristoyl)glucosamine N-acyltransferase [Corticibacter populi]RMX06007.1 UDP-3-O-(3-hydroxymyristoyl)glucosamine N-acyltransferase [Corticibacter populi]RZS31110.1 UDP-3-O-[3-hydroxymyristoyl] glucosamine N-acyltransferase [Corticibacter populi]
MSLTLGTLCASLGGELHGDASKVVQGIAPLDSAGPGDIAFLSNPRYIAQLHESRAACVIVAPAQAEQAQRRGACIVTPNPYLYYARLSQWWRQQHPAPWAPGIHPSAVVHPDAHVDATASIGPLSVIEAGAVIGAHTRIASRVTVGYDCVIGAHCIVHSGVVIGADGFGFAPDGAAWVKIEQLGAVRIGDEVEIGANTCIDRGALGDTVIANGVKLDNLIQIAHNVHVGENTAMAACVGIAGSAHIGAGCTLAGGAAVLGHLQIADGVHVSARTVVTRSLHQPGQYSGLYPFEPHAQWEQNAASLRQLRSMRDRLKILEKEMAALQERLP